jgi:hypothetical protein
LLPAAAPQDVQRVLLWAEAAQRRSVVLILQELLLSIPALALQLVVL